MPHARLVVETALRVALRAADGGLGFEDILVVVADAADPGAHEWALSLAQHDGRSREEASGLLVRALTANAERGQGTLIGSYLELSRLRVRDANAPPVPNSWRELIQRSYPPGTGRLVYISSKGHYTGGLRIPDAS